MSKILLLPKWMNSLKLYNSDIDFVAKIGKLDQDCRNADLVVGVSLGALAILRDINFVNGKIVLVNPPLPKRSIFMWFVRWIRFFIKEGLFLERNKFTKNPMMFISAFFDHIKLLRVDFSDVLKKIPKNRILVIRGIKDNFFCDNEACLYLDREQIPFIEVDGGHNWSEAIEEQIRLISLG